MESSLSTNLSIPTCFYSLYVMTAQSSSYKVLTLTCRIWCLYSSIWRCIRVCLWFSWVLRFLVVKLQTSDGGSFLSYLAVMSMFKNESIYAKDQNFFQIQCVDCQWNWRRLVELSCWKLLLMDWLCVQVFLLHDFKVFDELFFEFIWSSTVI